MKFSEIFNVRKTEEDDWFDPILTLDTKLFLDPFLLYASESGVFEGSHEWIIKFFNDVFSLIARSGGERTSVSWRKAENLLLFPEVQELCLGYTGSGTNGLGSGKTVAKAVAEALWEAVLAGIKEISHFEEVRLLREGVGADRISDSTAWLIFDRLTKYTETICDRHQIPTNQLRYLRGKYDPKLIKWCPLPVSLPRNPYNKKGIVLIPRKYLRDLPTINPDGFWEYCCNDENEALRNSYSFDVSSRVDKKTIINFAKNHPEARAAYIHELEDDPPCAYDYENDRMGYVRWYDETLFYCRHKKLTLPLNSPEDFRSAIFDIVKEFKNYVENNAGWRLLWNEDNTPKREEACQLLFLGIVKHYCKANNIDITRESNIGRGPVDFKISRGYRSRVLLEVKLARNTKFWNGLTKQLPKYQEAEGIDFGFFLVVLYSEKDLKKVKDIESVVALVNQETGYKISPLIIDARSNPTSASKL